mmetsp:Transcript_22379/g.63898  ORF Transcript_22379/g.63898 Transcript_22379/m.63898 type:complete len:248 (+) Transcript_22379:596-1339(+)
MTTGRRRGKASEPRAALAAPSAPLPDPPSASTVLDLPMSSRRGAGRHTGEDNNTSTRPVRPRPRQVLVVGTGTKAHLALQHQQHQQQHAPVTPTQSPQAVLCLFRRTPHCRAAGSRLSDHPDRLTATVTVSATTSLAHPLRIISLAAAIGRGTRSGRATGIMAARVQGKSGEGGPLQAKRRRIHSSSLPRPRRQKRRRAMSMCRLCRRFPLCCDLKRTRKGRPSRMHAATIEDCMGEALRAMATRDT